MLTVNYHIHTHYSPCASNDMLLPAILDAAEQAGLTAVGISDHCYSFDLNSDRIRALREEVREAAKGRNLKVYLGIEAYVLHHRAASVTPRIASLFDYVTVAPNHYHIRGVAQPVRLHPRILAEHELYMFEAAIGHPATDVIAHPFVLSPRIFRLAPDRLAQLSHDMMEELDEKRLSQILDKARMRGLAIELNPKFLYFDQEHIAGFYRLCLEQGIPLCYGSDAHELEDVAISAQAASFVESIGLTEESLWHPLR